MNVCDPPSEMNASGSKFDNTYGPSVVLIQQDGAYTEMDASSQTSSSITIDDPPDFSGWSTGGYYFVIMNVDEGGYYNAVGAGSLSVTNHGNCS